MKRDKLGRLWKLEVTYTDPKHQEWEFVPKGITGDGQAVTFPELMPVPMDTQRNTRAFPLAPKSASARAAARTSASITVGAMGDNRSLTSAPDHSRQLPLAVSFYERASASITGINPRVESAWLWPAVTDSPMSLEMTAHKPQQRTATTVSKNQRGMGQCSRERSWPSHVAPGRASQ